MISKRTITAMNRDFTEQVNYGTALLGRVIGSMSELTEADTFHAEVDGTMYRIAPVDDAAS